MILKQLICNYTMRDKEENEMNNIIIDIDYDIYMDDIIW